MDDLRDELNSMPLGDLRSLYNEILKTKESLEADVALEKEYIKELKKDVDKERTVKHKKKKKKKRRGK